MTSNNKTGRNMLIDKYLSGQLTPEEADLLLSQMESDHDTTRRICDNIEIDFLIRERIKFYEGSVSVDAAREEDDHDDFFNFPVVCRQDPLHNTTLVYPGILEIDRNSSFFHQDPQKINSREAASSTRILPRWIRYALVLIPLAILIVVGVAYFFMASEFDQQIFERPIASIVEAIDVDEASRAALKRGRMLTPDRLAFSKGFVRLKLGEGINLTVEGPAQCVLNGDNTLFCQHGKISVDVEEQVDGFEIVTPFGKIIDRGTRFVLEVTENDFRFDVLEGLVEMEGSSRMPPVSVPAGEACRFDVKKKIEKIPADAVRFLDEERFDSMLNQYVEKEEQRERERVAAFDARSDLLVRLDFAQNEGGRFTNLSQLGRNLMPQAKSVGCDTTVGEYHTSRAICPRGRESLIEFPIQKTMQSVTLAALVRVDRLEHYGSVLFSCNDFSMKSGGVLWQVLRSGALQVQVCREKSDMAKRSGAGLNAFVTPEFFSLSNLKTWVRVAVVLDGTKKTIEEFNDFYQYTNYFASLGDARGKIGDRDQSSFFTSNTRGFFGGGCWVAETKHNGSDDIVLWRGMSDIIDGTSNTIAFSEAVASAQDARC